MKHEENLCCLKMAPCTKVGALLFLAATCLVYCSSVQKKSTSPITDKEDTSSENSDDDTTDESATKPVMISGSWLTCGPTNSGVLNEYGCYYTDKDKRKVNFDGAKWAISIVTEDGQTYEITDLSNAPEGSPWNIIFTLPPELDGRAFEINGDVQLKGTPTSPECPLGYILVPGDAFYQTKDFCVMKYEAKKRNPEGKIIVYSDVDGLFAKWLTFSEAQEACRDLGTSYSLVTNAEWMTIAANIAATKTNWSGNAVGSGAINRGHSDDEPLSYSLLNAELDENACFGTLNDNCLDRQNAEWSQKRTHVLSNNEVIWDLAGNAKEWVDFGENRTEALQPYVEGGAEMDLITSDSSDMKITEIRPTTTSHSWWKDSWNSKQGLGKYLAGASGFNTAILRGGAVGNGVFSGIFAVRFASPQEKIDNIDFRCVYHK